MNDEPSPTYWPGQADHEATGPIGDGTPHARMHWFWKRMEGYESLIAELTGWSSFSSSYRFEAAIVDAFDKLRAERDEAMRVPTAKLDGILTERLERAETELAKQNRKLNELAGDYASRGTKLAQAEAELAEAKGLLNAILAPCEDSEDMQDQRWAEADARAFLDENGRL